MSGFFLTDFIARRAREKRVRLAATWPTIPAQILTWKILNANEESAVNTHQIEAAFSFVINGDYFGGYLLSTPMPHRDAERHARGNPIVTVRYNPANPDQVVALAEDNATTLPFAILPG
jgi:hypothetical protein